MSDCPKCGRLMAPSGYIGDRAICICGRIGKVVVFDTAATTTYMHAEIRKEQYQELITRLDRIEAMLAQLMEQLRVAGEVPDAP